jgi:hypothetical protein
MNPGNRLGFLPGSGANSRRVARASLGDKRY